ncbi:MAG: valine--tRNA ligase [Planctomycetes bacterium]|nr:valine--tRNA ligase [Planctomycetota bacterium]
MDRAADHSHDCVRPVLHTGVGHGMARTAAATRVVRHVGFRRPRDGQEGSGGTWPEHAEPARMGNRLRRSLGPLVCCPRPPAWRADRHRVAGPFVAATKTLAASGQLATPPYADATGTVRGPRHRPPGAAAHQSALQFTVTFHLRHRRTGARSLHSPPRMTTELPAKYDPATLEPAVTARWLQNKAFAATTDRRDNRYVVMMPLPNVTGALHMGHAMDNVMQDLLIRWHRMQGDNTLWQAGTDHAGIATQAVVEKRLKEIENKTRHDVGRDGLVQRIQDWAATSQKRIVGQQQGMGCSCDWDRARFTMDAVCARAVRHTFFKMFADGLIFRGDRLVNWDCHLQTAVADDELYKATVQGKFHYLRYPVIGPQAGEPTHVVVATTRPETMLGDTAVAVHPDPATAMAEAIAAQQQKLQQATAKERAEAETELERLRARERDLLPALVQIAAMAKAGRKVRLPLVDREIPIIADTWADPTLGTGCVKITPAHDPNDYAVWQRHPHIGVRNVLAADGSINDNGGRYRGQDRFAARKAVMADLQALGLVEKVEDREIEIDHSDRSKTIVEPWLSKQWFVRMADVPGGVTMGKGTAREFRAAGLAQAALDASAGRLPAPRKQVAFHPDPERYRKMYDQWLAEKRDWCISRQLWWGHRIPVWRGSMPTQKLLMLQPMLGSQLQRDDVCAWILLPDGSRLRPADAFATLAAPNAPAEIEVQICFRDETADQNVGPILQGAGLQLDPDVLDTWFSSALWPHSTLGWPDPATARVNDAQPVLGAHAAGPDALSFWYPGSCLVTGRDIITLWVARMVITGLYNLGDVPFTDVFLHATILDGRGERMSKSKGNGIDPLDIIARYGADALRYVVCELQTGTQDIRLPVQAISPFTNAGEPEKLIDLATAKPGPYLGTFLDPETKQPMDLVGQYGKEGITPAKATSERFTVGANFCNKVFNAARFAFLNLEGSAFVPLRPADLRLEDRWILSRLQAAIASVHGSLQAYNPSAAIGTARDFFWNELCDWYLEMIKPRFRAEAAAASTAAARQVLAAVLDQTLRLLHPFVPFLTETLWSKLRELAPVRGLASAFADSEMIVHANWPQADAAWSDRDAERQVATMQAWCVAIREARARYQVAPKDRVPCRIAAEGATAATLQAASELLAHMAGLAAVEIGPNAQRTPDSATVVVGDAKAFLLGVVDLTKERQKLQQQAEKLQAQIGGIEQKLGNPGFVAKAPPAVVAQQQQNLEQLRQQLAGIRQSLQELGG